MSGVDAVRAERLASGWVYQGPEAAKVPALSSSQVSYAITLRRQLAEGLMSRAAAQASFVPSQAIPFWLGVSEACRAEVRRCERAHRRLADAPMRDAFSDPKIIAAYDERLAQIPRPAKPEPLA